MHEGLPPRGLGEPPEPPWATAAAREPGAVCGACGEGRPHRLVPLPLSWGPRGEGGGSIGRGYELRWGHIRIAYQNPTYYTKPQPKRTEQSPEDYTKTKKTRQDPK